MKIAKILCISAIIISFAIPGFAQGTKRTAEITDMAGSVQVKLAKEASWVNAGPGTTLSEGATIKTGPDSWATLKLNGASETASVNIEKGSELMISELTEDIKTGTQSTLLDLAIGKVLIKAQKLHAKESKFEVKTPTSIVGVRGTEFSVGVEALD